LLSYNNVVSLKAVVLIGLKSYRLNTGNNTTLNKKTQILPCMVKVKSKRAYVPNENLPNKHELQKWQDPVLCFPCPCIKEHYILIWWTNKCTCINVSNHILLLFINMFQSLLWPISGCYITISAKRQMYEYFRKLLFQFFQNNNMTVNEQTQQERNLLFELIYDLQLQHTCTLQCPKHISHYIPDSLPHTILMWSLLLGTISLI